MSDIKTGKDYTDSAPENKSTIVNGFKISNSFHGLEFRDIYIDATKYCQTTVDINVVTGGVAFEKYFKEKVGELKRALFFNSFNFSEITIDLWSRFKDSYFEVNDILDTLRIERFKASSSGLIDYKGTFYTKEDRHVFIPNSKDPDDGSKKHVKKYGTIRTSAYHTKFTIPSYNDLLESCEHAGKRLVDLAKSLGL
jgi:hypothetical protein